MTEKIHSYSIHCFKLFKYETYIQLYLRNPSELKINSEKCSAQRKFCGTIWTQAFFIVLRCSASIFGYQCKSAIALKNSAKALKNSAIAHLCCTVEYTYLLLLLPNLRRRGGGRFSSLLHTQVCK